MSQTLDLLEGPFHDFARGVAEGRYVLWLGSAISRERFPDLGKLIAKVLVFLHTQVELEGLGGPHRKALEEAVKIAGLRRVGA